MAKKKKTKRRYTYQQGHEDVKEKEMRSKQGDKKVNKRTHEK